MWKRNRAYTAPQRNEVDGPTVAVAHVGGLTGAGMTGAARPRATQRHVYEARSTEANVKPAWIGGACVLCAYVLYRAGHGAFREAQEKRADNGERTLGS